MCKAISPTSEQAELMKRVGIHFPFLWLVVGDFTRGFMVKNIITGEIKMVDKE